MVEDLCLKSGIKPMATAFLGFASILFLIFSPLNLPTAHATGLGAGQIKTEWLQKSPLLQSYKSYDQVLSQVQKEYQQFHYPTPGDYSDEAALEKARQERIREIILFTVSNIKNSLSDFDTNRASAYLETGRDTLSSYGNQAVASLNTRIRPLLENFYENLLNFQGKALVSFLHSLGKEYWVLSSWPQKYTWSETAASKNLFYPLTKINKSIDISTQIQKFPRHASTNTDLEILQPSLFDSMERYFGIPVIYKTVDPAQTYALLVSIQFFCSGNLDNLSSFIRSSIISSPSYTQFHETGPNYLLFTALDRSLNIWGTMHDYTGVIHLLYCVKQYPIEVNVGYWILKTGETSKNRKAWKNNTHDMEHIATDISHKLLNAFIKNTETEKTGITFSLDPVTSVNIHASPDKKDSCRLRATVTDKNGHPVKGVPITFKKPRLGHLSSLNTVTDAGGRAETIYTAPTAAELEKLGKEEINVLVEATAGRTGTSSSVEIHVRSNKSKIAVRIGHEILPAHPDYFNRITFAVNAPLKPDAKPYKAIITIPKGEFGALTQSKDEKGGVRKLALAVFPKKRYDFYYHWTGPPAMMKAYEEAIVIEIPWLKIKKRLHFSVGIDLMIQSARMKYGSHVFPVMFEPFNIFLTDRFHPKADLAKLFKEFDLPLGLKIQQIAHIPAPPHVEEEGLLSALLTEWEGSSLHRPAPSIIFDKGKWGIRKTKDHKFLVCCVGRLPSGKKFVTHPGVNLLERGSYQFQVEVAPGVFDADPRDNKVVMEPIEVKDFPTEGNKLLHTVFLPSVEFLVSISDSVGVEIGFAAKDMILDVKNGHYKKAMLDLFASVWFHVCSSLRKSKVAQANQLKELGKIEEAQKLEEEANLLNSSTLASHAKTLIEMLPGLMAPKTSSRTPEPRQSCETPFSTNAYQRNLFKVLQATLKGAKDYDLVIVNQKGIQSLRVGPSRDTNSPIRKIFRGKTCSVLPLKRTGTLSLHLTGNGEPGRLTLMTPDRIIFFPYPTTSWSETLTIEGSGHIIAHAKHPASTRHFPPISGPWITNHGRLTLRRNGNLVTGGYDRTGRIVGFLKGNTLRGKWSKAPTYRPPNDAGEVELVFSPDGMTFTGRLRYGFEGNIWHETWMGRRSGNR